MKHLVRIEQELRTARIVGPTAPELAHAFRPTHSAAHARRAPASLTLPMRVITLLLLVGVVYAAVQIAGTRSGKTLAKLTPLRVVNEAWSAADGYVLNFEVYDDYPSNNGKDVNYQRFEAAAYEWADAKGLKRPHGENVWDSREMGLFIMRTGGAGNEGLYATTRAQINLRTDNQAVCDELITTLASLPGVVEPEIQRMTMYFGMGGLMPATENAKVIINGIVYEFPEDFSQQEAQDLYWAFSSFEHTPRVEYRAFSERFLAEETYAPRPGVKPEMGQAIDPRDIKVTRRFELGDVFRLTLDAAGNMTIDTYKEHWEVPQVTLDKLHLRSNFGGWTLSVPPGIDESRLDVLTELSRRFDPLPGDKEIRHYYVSLQYWVYPVEKVKSEGGRAVVPEARQAANKLSKELLEAFEVWKGQHPELQRSLVFGDRASAGIERAGKTPVALYASIETDDLTEYESMKAALDAVPGAPEPKVWQRDRTGFVHWDDLPAPLK